MLPLLKDEHDRFVLKLNKELYRDDIVQKALSEDKDWIKEMPAAGNYFCLQLKTSDIDDVFNWMNYLIYLHKA
jgi:hypothetical protein